MQLHNCSIIQTQLVLGLIHYLALQYASSSGHFFIHIRGFQFSLAGHDISHEGRSALQSLFEVSMQIQTSWGTTCKQVAHVAMVREVFHFCFCVHVGINRGGIYHISIVFPRKQDIFGGDRAAP